MLLKNVIPRPAGWMRAFVAVGVLWFVIWQAMVFLGADRRVVVIAAIYGFVMHVIFGKAYALIPSYFGTELYFDRAPMAQFMLTVPGTILLVFGTHWLPQSGLESPGAILWSLGVLVFVGTLACTVAGPFREGATGTSDANAERRHVDRFANGFIPIILAYLVLAAVLLVLREHDRTIVGTAELSHLIAVGTGMLLIFAVGLRLFPRFLVVRPHPLAAPIVLPTGGIGAGLLVVDFLGSGIFHLGAGLVTVGMVGFALAYVDMYRRSDRRRIGFQVVLLAVLFGMFAVMLALFAIFVAFDPPILEAHVRVATLGFLGLTIVGVSYQFYPPNISSTSGISNRMAMVAVVLIAGGLVLEVGGLLGVNSLVLKGGQALALVGGVVYAYVLIGLFIERRL